MAASAQDLLMEVGIATATTLDANYTISDSTVTVASTSGWPTATGVSFAIDVVDANGVQVAGSYNEYVGTVATATSISNVSHANGTDRNYSAGATTRVYIPVSAERENRIVEWGTTEHNQDGTHSDVTADSVVVSGVTTLDGALTLKSYDGWIQATNTWTYASANTITVAGVDITGKLQPGDRIKITQTTDKYFIVTKVAFSTDTTITVYGGTDYTVANAAITNPAYSRDKSPYGFPLDPAKWTITTTSSNIRSTTNTSFTSLTDSLSLPIGAWTVHFKAMMNNTNASGGTRTVFATLSSDTSTETYPQTTLSIRQLTGGSAFSIIQASTTTITTTSAITLTILGMVDGTATTLNLVAATQPTVIRAVCAYL